MLRRYLQIRECFSKLDINEPELLRLAPTEDKEIELLCEKLRDLYSITKSLQSNSMTCHKVLIFLIADCLVSKYFE